MLRLKTDLIAPPGGWYYTEPRSGLTIKGITFRQLLSNVDQHYANMGYDDSDLQSTVETGICDHMEPGDRAEYCTGYVAPWPLLLQPLKLLAQPGDKGLGDIVDRVIGPAGGDAYKAWYEKIFKTSCGCKKRQDNLNGRYPLESAT